MLSAREIPHYRLQFRDRPDYALLYEGSGVGLRREHLDEH